MRILITGGNGYVGRETTRLLSKEHEICVVDSIRYGEIRLRPEEISRIRFEDANILDAERISQIMTDFNPEAIIHLAAVHFIPECEHDPRMAVEINVLGTINLLLAAPANCRFVFASSGAVYKPAQDPHRETDAIEPSDIYGFSKLHGEQYVRYLARQRSLGAVIVRLFNVVGPGETNPHLIPEIVAQLKSGTRRVRLGNMWPKRDYIHVHDAARGFIAAALSVTESSEVVTVNLGTSHSYSVSEVLQKLQGISGIDFTYEEDRSRVRPVDRPHLAANNAEIRVHFGWQPQLTIDDALMDLWSDPDLSKQLLAKYQ